MSYGLTETDDIPDFLDVIENLVELRSLGVKKLVVDFHDLKGIDAITTYNFLREKLGEGKIIYEKTKLVCLGKAKRLTVLWNR